ncbi:myosin heavy chain-like [Gossypium australe]|uniref:Myosin heavy chain-like n=1 Tax=Gossypium australe TaxID=47621 RepID=A0A5B6W8A2_9ROSI|nr:myosin heavy chain-like [Gossypium australe]
MNEQWVTAQIKQKGDTKCIHWKSLQDLILAHPDTKKRVDIFAFSIYGLVIFPKAVGHIDDALDKRVTLVLTILAETFKYLSACQKAGEGRFIRCAQLLLASFHSHFWKVEKFSYRVFSKNYSPLKEFVSTPRRDSISEEKWMSILQSLQDEDVEWKAAWMIPDEILYRCGDFDWVPLLRIWGAIGYTPLLCEFAYKGDNYKKKVCEISNAWNQTHKMKRFAANPMTAPEYDWWWGKRVNDNVHVSSQENIRPIEEHLQVIPSELEIVKQDFERGVRSWGKR